PCFLRQHNSLVLPSSRPPPTSTLFPYTTLFRSSIHANEKCVGRKSRRSPSAVIWSRICDRIDTSTAPPTAPSGASVETLSTIARDRKSTRLNSSHVKISYAVFCLKKKKDRERLH